MPAQSRRKENVPAIHSDRFIFRIMQKVILKQEREREKCIENFHDTGGSQITDITVIDILKLLLFSLFVNICRL